MRTREAMRRILFNQLPGDGSPATAVHEQNPANPPAPSPADPPKTAATVLKGTVTEETLKLQQELEAERTLRKQREQEHASVTDEYQRYKDATEARGTAPQPVPVNPGKVKDEPKPRRFLRR